MSLTLTELKAQAQELGLTKEEIAELGDLRKKATWELAIARMPVDRSIDSREFVRVFGVEKFSCEFVDPDLNSF